MSPPQSPPFITFQSLPISLDVAALKARCPERRPGGEEFYGSIGNDYQGHFRSVSEIWLGADELLCCVELDPTALRGRPDLCAMAWLDGLRARGAACATP